MTDGAQPRAVIVQETMPSYRLPLLVAIQEVASRTGLQVEILHGAAGGSRGARLGERRLPGAGLVRNRYVSFWGRGPALVWQPILGRCAGAQLVVVEQANRLLVNYALLVWQRFGGPAVAFWGHGRNLQRDPTSVRERLKARLATQAYWWFAYTEGVATHLRTLGHAAERITVVGNTIDVAALQREVASARTDPAPRMRCLFLGGLYEEKRLDVLFAATDLLARELPDFELVIAGDGELRDVVEAGARDRSWVTYRGRVDGAERAGLLASARLLLVPGLVGLVALDSFAAGVPLVTAAEARHSPEVEYLRAGAAGRVVTGGLDPAVYAAAVADLLRDDEEHARLRAAVLEAAADHDVHSAAERFVDGMRDAIFSLDAARSRAGR